ncbi:MAG: hypothetical protein HN952_04560 [Candidatus Cloacimonetes bacterium]|jgi:hypothetical protein|nr:hypothetical protein [Candidatus Cloacimonadota bacterium]MBT6994211.1 hypothetical protein [Candidatus Cloacimonadota bacterium]MBT7469205.1 hypothetical protein [Candidatus Cloacimonadota bacterium]
MKKILLLGMLVVLLGAFFGCSEETTEVPKEAKLEFVSASVEITNWDTDEYTVSFTLQNTGNATATNIQGRIGFTFEGETEATWSPYVPLGVDITAGSTYSETMVDYAEDEAEALIILAAEITMEFTWETE